MSGDRLLLAAILATLFVPEVAGPNPIDQPWLAIVHALAWLILFVAWLAVAAAWDHVDPKDNA